MRKRKFLIVALVVLAGLLVLAVWVMASTDDRSDAYGDNNADFPEGIHFTCTGETCGHGFTLTVKQFGDHHANDATYGTPVKCPQCGTDAARADLCKKCGKYYSIAHDSSATCPYCNKPPAP